MAFEVTFLEWQADIYRSYDVEDGSKKVGDDHLSCDHDFVPYHALMAGRLLKKGDKKLLIYSRWCSDNYFEKRRTYDAFLNYGLEGRYWCKFAKRGVDLDFRTRFGEVVHVLPNKQVIPLAILAVNERYLYSIDKANPDPSQFFLVVNNALIREEQYDSLYRAFKKYYLAEVEKVCNVIYTNDITKLLYKPHIVKPKPAKNIMEMRQNMLAMHTMIVKEAQGR